MERFRSMTGQSLSHVTMSRFVLALLALGGLLLLALSVPLHETGGQAYVKVFLRELGIVIFAVFTISLLYELWLAKRYQEQFLSTLSEMIKEGETNAAVCAALGISQIFRSRYEFERSHPFRQLLASIVQGDVFRAVGRSLFVLMTHVDEVRAALSRGVHIELCLLDPSISNDELRTSPDVEPHDIKSTLAVFTSDVLPWLLADHPKCRVEIRCHRIHLLDSAVFIGSQLCIWEVSFGRALDSKRLFLADPSRGFGADLRGRYEAVWQRSKPVFRYTNGVVALNELIPPNIALEPTARA